MRCASATSCSCPSPARPSGTVSVFSTPVISPMPRCCSRWDRPGLWSEWFEAAGISCPDPYRGPVLDRFSMTIGAAHAGLGVALVPVFLVATDLTAKTLVALSTTLYAGAGAYYALIPPSKLSDRHATAFRQWLVEEGRNSRTVDNRRDGALEPGAPQGKNGMLGTGNARPGVLVLVAAEDRLAAMADVYAVRQVAPDAATEGIDAEDLDRGRGRRHQRRAGFVGRRDAGHAAPSFRPCPRVRGSTGWISRRPRGAGSSSRPGPGRTRRRSPTTPSGSLWRSCATSPASMRRCAAGFWQPSQRPTLSGKTCGILGYGAIGQAVAKRLAGFDVRIAYHSRRRVPGTPHPYHATPINLASESDLLFVCLPGGPATRHLVDAGLLKALGASGYLVNVGRGSVVGQPRARLGARRRNDSRRRHRCVRRRADVAGRLARHAEPDRDAARGRVDARGPRCGLGRGCGPISTRSGRTAR